MSRNDALEVGYMGTKGTFIDSSQLNFNSPDPGPGDIQSRRPYQGFARIRLLSTDGNSTYHSLQAHFEHRFAQGLSLTAAYNWAHMIDDQEDETNGNRSLAQDPRHSGKAEKASSIYDLWHRLVVGYVWELPFTSGFRGAIKAVFDGWQLGGIVTEQSGSPFRISQSADTQNNDSVGAARPDLVPGGAISVSNPRAQPLVQHSCVHGECFPLREHAAKSGGRTWITHFGSVGGEAVQDALQRAAFPAVPSRVFQCFQHTAVRQSR